MDSWIHCRNIPFSWYYGYMRESASISQEWTRRSSLLPQFRYQGAIGGEKAYPTHCEIANLGKITYYCRRQLHPAVPAQVNLPAPCERGNPGVLNGLHFGWP